MAHKIGHSNFRGTANPEYAEGMRELRRSNAAGLHEDRRTRRVRARSDANRAAIKDAWATA